jgi:putative acyl-CoA dehydrogenase
MPALPAFATHRVFNQVPPLQDYCLYDTDCVLRDAVNRQGAGAHEPELRRYGSWLGQAHVLQAGHLANRHPPRLDSYDATGHRIDRIDFHSAWHTLMAGIVEQGLHSAAWDDASGGAQVARAAAYLMQGQVDAGTLCPTTMTFAALPLLRDEPPGVIDFNIDWLPGLRSRQYDPADVPAVDKQGLLMGMGLTEKQGGSDLRAVQTRAEPRRAAGRGQAYLLTGHKWFYSAPQADAHLVLAQAPDGLACFFVPRWTPGGERNAVRIRRLKDKLGNRGNASGEVEFEQAWGVMIGEPGRGLPILLEMAATTRLDCVLGSAALLRHAVAQSLHHARHRAAFGKTLAEQPLMRAVLADLALESEAATLLALRLARAVDQRGQSEERLLVRVGTPAAKLWVCKRAIGAVAEALEAWGGNGYVEDGPMPRLYRETPVNSIWEGSGNVMALDVLRAMQHDSGVRDVLMAELEPACSGHQGYARALDAWLLVLDQARDAPQRARGAAAGLARLWQAALLLEHAPAVVGDAFVRTRLLMPGGVCGEDLSTAEAQVLLERAWLAIC